MGFTHESLMNLRFLCNSLYGSIVSSCQTKASFAEILGLWVKSGGVLGIAKTTRCFNAYSVFGRAVTDTIRY